MDLKYKIRTKLDEISSLLSKGYANVDEYGLMSGTTGISLFFYGMYTMTGSESHKNDMLRCLDKAIDAAAGSHYFPTYASGLAGLGCYISFLERRKLIEDYIDDDIDEALFASLNHYISKNDYDYLHGAVGVALYFYYRFANTGGDLPRRAIELIVEYLDSVKRPDKNGIKWVSHNFTTKEEEYNISLSHGMASILAFLMRLKRLDAFPQLNDKLDYLITNAASYIYAQRIDYTTYGSFYPYMALESTAEIHKSRLAWCYGDLGVAYTMKDYGKLYNDKEIYDHSIKALETDAVERRDLAGNMVVDSGLCHGAAGISLIYNNLYLETGLHSFKDSADYWIEQVLKLGQFDNPDYAGFKIYSPMDHNHQKNEYPWRESYGLLEGIAGIGLALAANVYEKSYDWDEVMFLK